MPSGGRAAGWGDSRVSNKVNRSSSRFSPVGGEAGRAQRRCCAPPTEVRGGFSKAVTFEPSPKEEHVLWDEDSGPRKGDIKSQVLRLDRAECAQGNTRNWAWAVERVSGHVVGVAGRVPESSKL